MIYKEFTPYKIISELFFATLLKFLPKGNQKVSCIPITPNITQIKLQWTEDIIVPNYRTIKNDVYSEWIYLKNENVLLVGGDYIFATISLNIFLDNPNFYLKEINLFEYLKNNFNNFNNIHSFNVTTKNNKKNNIKFEDAIEFKTSFMKNFDINNLACSFDNIPFLIHENNTITFYDTTKDEKVISILENICSNFLLKVN